MWVLPRARRDLHYSGFAANQIQPFSTKDKPKLAYPRSPGRRFSAILELPCRSLFSGRLQES
jgi:hypothetical protein